MVTAVILDPIPWGSTLQPSQPPEAGASWGVERLQWWPGRREACGPGGPFKELRARPGKRLKQVQHNSGLVGVTKGQVSLGGGLTFMWEETLQGQLWATRSVRQYLSVCQEPLRGLGVRLHPGPCAHGPVPWAWSGSGLSAGARPHTAPHPCLSPSHALPSEGGSWWIMTVPGIITSPSKRPKRRMKPKLPR